ncbi:MAG TPA: ABC transporter permease, partial [Amaricoccus sp.]|nr:ABC transporter permease [Amaricoccus sp.]
MPTDPSFRYPLRWRAMDAVERMADLLWPRSMARLTGWLMLLPALLLVGLLVLGLVQIADSSLRTLDTSTFLMSESY